MNVNKKNGYDVVEGNIEKSIENKNSIIEMLENKQVENKTQTRKTKTKTKTKTRTKTKTLSK